MASDTCIYCSNRFTPTSGEGDHIIPRSLGEFRGDVRFKHICPECNNRISPCEQQMVQCGPEGFFRDVVSPARARSRARGRGRTWGVKGVPANVITMDRGDHRELVRLSPENPEQVLPIDQIVVHDDSGKEHFIRLFPGMRPEQLRERVKRTGIQEPTKTWFHFDEPRRDEYIALLQRTWPSATICHLPDLDPGIHDVSSRVTCTVNEGHFRAVAKIAFHYYLAHTQRGLRGDEPGFAGIRSFIMRGGGLQPFFHSSRRTFRLPYGELPSGGILVPPQWCHVLAADESDRVVVAYVHLFLSPMGIPTPHYITLGNVGSQVIAPTCLSAHVYAYDEKQPQSGFAGCVARVSVTRVV